MSMGTVFCRQCGYEKTLRGWIIKEDLIGTQYEDQIDIITEEELLKLDREDKIKNEWSRFEEKFDENPICPECGSEAISIF